MKRLSQAPWILLAGAAVAFLLAELLLFPSDASGWLHFGLGATLITSVGAVALAQYRLRRESERYQAVTRIQREFTDLPSEEIIDHIIQFLAELIPQAEKCVLHMLDEENQRLYPRYASQRNNGLRTGMPADRGIAGQAIKTRRTILRNHVTEDSDFLPLDSNSQLRSLIVGPLYFGDQPLGTISLNSSRRNAFGERDRLILAAFARQASIALHQERLLAARQADHDALAAVTRNLDEAFLILDGDQRILQHNAALARILGADMEPLTGKQLSVTSDDEKIRRLAYIIGDISDEKSRHWEKTIHLEEPVPLTLRIQDQKLTKDGGDGRRVILLYDQSHRHQALREQAAILRGLAIEMGADSTGSLTERGVLWVEALETWADVREASPGRYPLLETLPYTQWHQRLRNTLHQAAAERKVELCIEGLPQDAAKPPSLEATLTPLALRLVVDDALQRSRPGEKIEITLSLTGSELLIRVKDRGRPLDDDDRGRILAAEYQAALPEKATFPSGLAIYVAKELTQNVGGHLWMPASPPRHTTVQLALPTREH